MPMTPAELDALLPSNWEKSPELRALTTDKQRRFALALSMQAKRNLADASRSAGYGQSDGSSEQNYHETNGSRLAHDPKIAKAVRALCEIRLASSLGPATSAILEIVESPITEPSVKLRAAATVLDRSGISVHQRIDVSHTETVEHKFDAAQTAAFYERLKEISGRGMTPALPAPVEDAEFVEVEEPEPAEIDWDAPEAVS